MKKQIVETLLGTGHKVALRSPLDHSALYQGNQSVTIHNDCIFDGGPNGVDGGTFPDNDRQTWVDYTKQVAGGNTYGGEGCDNAGPESTYNWTNYDNLCGSNGLAAYINAFKISYMNVSDKSWSRDSYNYKLTRVDSPVGQLPFNSFSRTPSG